ncbi:MAG: hypothetical protein IGS39_04925 [Calothrix sp. C42_A2020_038]|nr:hypothetical protein [Calothrix sp. C42_A2020_038]
MLELNTLAEFSRTNCISICAFLVPANIIATLITMVLVFLHRYRPSQQVWQAHWVASIFAVAMMLHVYTWFEIGVVMAQTYILLSLAISCLLTNIGLVWLHRRMVKIVLN